MPKITLKLQDLKTGDTSFREFGDEDETMSFLRERPQFTDVLGVVFDRAHEVFGSSPCGHDHEAVASSERRTLDGQGRRRLAKRLEAANPYQACDARGNHCSFGGSMSVRSSFWALFSIISAPAAADEASHAVAI